MMSKMEFEKILQAFEDCGLDPRPYSGRGMYGKECLGIVTDENPLEIALMLVSELATAGDYDTPQETLDALLELLEELRRPLSDNLGRGTIVYWPRIKWERADNS
jgi:hypothetical protein